MDDPAEAILARLSQLDREILLTIEDAQEFLRLIQSYVLELDAIQERLLELKKTIQSGTFTQEINTEVQRQIRSFESLSNPEVKQKLLNRYEIITNFENYAVAESDRLILNYFVERLDEMKPFLN